MAETHTIRLHGPWMAQWIDLAGTPAASPWRVRVPLALFDRDWPVPAGAGPWQLILQRRFNWPHGQDSLTEVALVLLAPGGARPVPWQQVRLNGRPLACQPDPAANAWRAPGLANRLEPFNTLELQLEVPEPTSLADCQLSEVRLEITAPA